MQSFAVLSHMYPCHTYVSYHQTNFNIREKNNASKYKIKFFNCNFIEYYNYHWAAGCHGG